jgi:hypothetical protein
MNNKPGSGKTPVIPNPARKLNKPVKQERYMPEYVKLGIDPIKPAKVSSADFLYARDRRKPMVTSSSKEQAPKQQAPAQLQKPFKLIENKYPPQVNVRSGFNHEHTWRPTAQFYDEETGQQNDQEGYVDESVSYEELQAEEATVTSEKIRFDKIEDDFNNAVKPELKTMSWEEGIHEAKANPWLEEEAEAPSSLSSHDSLNINAVNQGEYFILINNQIIDISASLVETEQMVEKILFDESSADISAEDVKVFKRCSIKAGVVIKE